MQIGVSMIVQAESETCSGVHRDGFIVIVGPADGPISSVRIVLLQSYLESVSR